MATTLSQQLLTRQNLILDHPLSHTICASPTYLLLGTVYHTQTIEMDSD